MTNLYIVIAAYNRTEPLMRLLKSVDAAILPEYSRKTVTIYSDGPMPKGIDRPSRELMWHDHVGLKDHLIRCLDLWVGSNGACILLEDDLVVSPYFLKWAKAAVTGYEDDPRIAAISLHSPQYCEYTGLPFVPLQNGYDNYFLQVPVTSGTVWTKKNWRMFRKFYAENPEVPADAPLPEMVKSWPATSLKKHIAHYLVSKDKTVVYPRVSFATNFGDPGTHHAETTHKFQVPLCYGLPREKFTWGDNLFYDAFYEPSALLDDEIIPFDPLRLKPRMESSNVISCCDIANPIRSWGLRMLPVEANIMHDIQGDDIHLGPADQFEKPTWKTRQKLISYYSRFSTQTPDLVDFWKKRADQCQSYAASEDRFDYNTGRAHAFEMCADELERTPRIE